MNNIQAINTIRDNLRTNLTDPYVTAGGKTRAGWIFADEPIAGASYPIIEIKKLDNPSVPIEIGSNYMEQHQLFLNIWFYTKNGFKINVNGTNYVNSQMVEYYLDQIKVTLKSQFNTLFDAGVGGYKHINTTVTDYDNDTQLYFGAVTIRVWFFRK